MDDPTSTGLVPSSTELRRNDSQPASPALVGAGLQPTILRESAGSDPWQKGNREVVTDCYVVTSVDGEYVKFAPKIFVRLNAQKRVKFTKVSFQHCIFENCYFNQCAFDSCQFTGSKFIGCNFHECSFEGCDFRYTLFERTQIDKGILESEAPKEENLRMRFARSLRMNYSQLGDAEAVNEAISVELQATRDYLYKSWVSQETYYRKKYRDPAKRVWQFLRWFRFRALDLIWGNGESVLKFVRTIGIVVILVAVYDTSVAGGGFLDSLAAAPAVLLGVVSKAYPASVLAAITVARLIGVAVLITLLVKRFGRR